MHLHFERNVNSKCDCNILSLSWMGKVPDELPEEEGWKLNRNNYYQEGWLATGNIRGVVGVTFTTSHARRAHELPVRTNYNLRGHRSDVILVKWNEPYQKLASCDSSGVIFVWIKYEGRWSIELINDRSTPVTHFSWSHDGRMALICYQGSIAKGQKPELLVISSSQSFYSETMGTVWLKFGRCLARGCHDAKCLAMNDVFFNNILKDGFVLVGSVAGQRYWSSMLSLDARITCGCWTPDDNQVYLGTASAQLVVMDVHGAMVSQVQLVDEGSITSMAWSCEKFKMEEGEDVESTSNHVLAVALGKGEIVLLRGHDDVSPVRVNTGMRGETLAMEWANSRELLAVAGTLVAEAGEPEDAPPYKNVVKFYTDTGILIYTVPIPCNQAPVTALTWGHAARRVFVGVGGAICTARVWRAVAPLQLLARVRAAQSLRHPRLAPRLPLPPRLQPALANLFAHTIRCNVPESSELRRFVSRPPPTGGRLHCTMIRHGDDEHGCYTLYLEHLGGLVPLLKGRRTSKIRPEFVIFDPQAEEKATFTSNSLSSCTNGKDSSSGAASSSSAGSSKGSIKGFNSPKNSPRTPRHARRFPTPQMHIDTSSSDTEREEGCAASPKMQRRRKARERRKMRQAEREDTLEGLPVDCLPEDVRLVEVTSNIWGTKFKMHGLAKNVPANLGQVTYKTSLLHLQPRQMTLMITELRDDFPIGPDPTFNPNIFSEDEEDVFHSGESATESPSHVPVDRMKRKLTLVDRPTPLPAVQQSETHTAGCIAASLARAESYDEFPYIDNGENSSDSFTPRAAPTSVPGRHAISPLRCEASVPTLQSPKNAVAPTDIIFERPSPQTVACGGRGDFYGRADYSVRSDSLALKNLVDQQPYVKKVDASTPDASCLSKLRKNICGRDSYDVNARILKSLCARTEGGKDELRYIDEEGSPPARVQRTTTVVPISPVCAPPIVDTMTRSCSVGYLDLVDPRHAQVTVAALRGEPPRRLVLVNPRRQRRRRNPPTPPSPPAKSERAPSLRRCGKSRSLDSSDMPLAASAVESAKLKKHKGKVTENEEVQRVLCSSCRLSAPIGTTHVGGAYVCTTCATRAAPSVPPPAPSPRLATDSDSDYSKYYSSLEQLALRLLASRATRRGRADRETSSAPASPRAARSRPDSSAAVPPRTPKPQRTRHSSASPIRQLLNSPLLNRRRNKKPSESSDDEYSTGGYSEVNGKNFRDLESFQKAQLRNKLIRAGGVPNTAVAPAATGECRARRQLVMHNKAPMWNENSQVYQLDFGGRVTQESAKNFQIEYHGKQVMQFGRIDGNAYTLDFQYPFSALQAFAVALANVTQRLK